MSTEHANYTTLIVGQPYSSECSSWPSETPHWVLADDMVELAMFISDPTTAERYEFQHGRVKFAAVTGDHALVLAVKVGKIPWWDAPWQAVRQTVTQPGLPDDHRHLEVLMVLVNARTGIVQEMRLTSWPPRFVQAVRKSVMTQLAQRSDDRAGEIEVETWLARYPTPAELVRQRAELVVNGGPDGA